MFFKSVLENFNVQVSRVNTFHILQPIHKGPFTFKLCMKGPLRLRSFVPGPQITEHHQIYSMVKFIEQNLIYILLYFSYKSLR
jgi:hypothetical protein